ncbi:MAG: Fe-S-containing protein [Patescibacteria group bacterium]
MLKTINIQIEGTHCQKCKTKIETEINVLEGVNNIEVDSGTGEAWAEFDDQKISKKKIFEEINKLDYRVKGKPVNKPEQKKQNEAKQKKQMFTPKRLIIAGVTLVVLVSGYWLFSSGQGDSNQSKSSAAQNVNNVKGSQATQPDFTGEQGEKVTLENKQVSVTASTLDDGKAHFYNVEMPSEKIVYFFVVKDKNGIYRAAANACQVCFDTRMGFYQQGDNMICKTCGNQYPLTKIASEKGGCNPGPINPNLQVVNGKLAIDQSDIEQVAELF